MDAFNLIEDATSGYRGASSSAFSATAGAQHVFSVELKSSNLQAYLQLADANGGANVFFNLQSGVSFATVTWGTWATVSGISIAPQSSGRYLCKATYTVPAASSTVKATIGLDKNIRAIAESW
jgi:hypothetical protein